MKKVVYNIDNIKEEKVDEIVKRVKVLLINSNKKVLLGYSGNVYQFIGGHVDEGESLLQTINREVLEETGININASNIKPFALLEGFYNNYRNTGKVRENEIYYYDIKTDDKINLDKTNYTEDELVNNFKLEYIDINNIEKTLLENQEKYNDNMGIVKEMLEILKIYKENNND